MANRKSGFYWVHFKDSFNDEWVVGEYHSVSDRWYIPGSEEFYKTAEFHDLGDNMLEAPSLGMLD